MVTTFNAGATHLQFNFHQYENQSLPFMRSKALIIKTELFSSEDFPLELIPMCHFHAHYLSGIDLIDM